MSVHPEPATIHDLSVFPQELFDVQNPAPGAPDAAHRTAATVVSFGVHEGHERGLDHGAWSILKHIYPQADVPVFQLSLHWCASMEEHFKLAQDLRVWRNEGILIPGSGNVVHDLGRLNWTDPSAPAYAWALEFDRFVQEKVTNGDHQALVHFESLGATARMANPTNEPYLPLL